MKSDLLGKDVGEEWPNIEVPIQQYKYIVRNDDEVIDRISSDVSNPRENSAVTEQYIPIDYLKTFTSV